jgi:hypothetical protein
MIPETFPSLAESYRQSQAKLEDVEKRIRELVPGPHDHICVFAVGSYGRSEAQAAVSDFEWMTVYDDTRVGSSEALVFQSHLTAYFASVFGRDKLSINKTFGDVAAIADLHTNVGGEADTNRALTYRILALCEGRVVNQSNAHEAIIGRLASAYGGSHTAGHRLLSLATDVARYWRTLRIDYKYKVDEKKKSWAVRALKLRSARRLAYFSSALHFVAFGPRLDYDQAPGFASQVIEDFMRDMAGNPVERILRSIREMGVDEDVANRLLAEYEIIHKELGDTSVRNHIERLNEKDRFGDETFQRLRLICVKIHQLAAEFIQCLPSPHQQQMIEMFLL